jgi:hypothetical protein
MQIRLLSSKANYHQGYHGDHYFIVPIIWKRQQTKQLIRKKTTRPTEYFLNLPPTRPYGLTQTTAALKQEQDQTRQLMMLLDRFLSQP